MSSSIFIYPTRPRMFRMAAVVYVRVEQTVDGLLMEESAEVAF